MQLGKLQWAALVCAVEGRGRGGGGARKGAEGGVGGGMLREGGRMRSQTETKWGLTSTETIRLIRNGEKG